MNGTWRLIFVVRARPSCGWGRRGSIDTFVALCMCEVVVEQGTMVATVESIAELVSAGQLEEAAQALGAVEQSDENRAEILFLRGFIQEQQFERETAWETYEQVLEIEPEHRQASFRAALLADMFGDDEQAVSLYETCVGTGDAPTNAVINLAVLYEESGRLDDAKRCLENVIATYPNHRRARSYLRSVESAYGMHFDEKIIHDHEQRSALLDTPVADFELSVRSRNCLRQMSIRTLGDLLRTTEAELLSYKNFGETSLNEIKVMLTQKNLSLGQSLCPVETAIRPVSPPAEGLPPAAPDKLISELELSVRSRRCLQALGIHTLGDLVARSEAELMTIKNFGQTSMVEIKEQLALYGMGLR